MSATTGYLQGESLTTGCLKHVLEFSRTVVSLQDAELRYTWSRE
ncbi:MAG: hypothetical protein ACYC9O_10610 [Candidatus Latescibacterota bacterium]